jgi:phasin family protein
LAEPVEPAAVDTAAVEPEVAPASMLVAAQPSAESPPVGLQTIASAYRDYTRKSLAEATSFVEKLAAARSLDKAVEAQTEFARQACETFAADSRKIRTLYQELFWQSLKLPNWPPGQAQR